MSGKKVAFSSESYVYTVAPRKLIPLIKQRVRWMYGFIKNMLDYKFLLFKTDYKHIGILVLPANIFGIISVLILVPLIAYSLIKSIYFFIEKTIVTGWIPGHVGASSWFFIDTRPEAIIRILTVVILITTIFLGRSILKKKYLSWDILAILIYPYISIIWTVKAIWNAIRSKKSAWR
jgi:cellulose synthase/poly-beta-1,6-N-acetylglucosamine synthase-like glycosyltransferase